MTNKERLKKATDRIRRARSLVLGKVEGLSQNQLDFKPYRSHWSVGEIAHHLGLAEEIQLGYVRELLQAGSKERKATRKVSLDELPLGVLFVPDAILRFPLVLAPISLMTSLSPQFLTSALFANPFVKTKTAPRMQPRPGIPRAELLDFLDRVRRSTLKILEPVEDWDLSRFRYQHPLIGNQDIYGLLDLLASHDERHARQIEHVKKRTEFPK